MILDRGRAVFLLLIIACSLTASSSEQNRKQRLADEIGRLYSSKSQVRTDAAKQLAAIGPSAVPELIQVVCDRSKPNFDTAWPLAAGILGDLKAKAAVPCLIELMMYKYPSIGPVEMKPDETLANVDPSFAALVHIGEPTVPALRKHLPFLGPEGAIMALRVLRAINTPSARDAAEAYIRILRDQLRLSKQILEDFGEKQRG